MKKKIILTTAEILSFILVFVASLFLFGRLFNKDNMDLTKSLEEGNLPLVSVLFDEYRLGSLPGYVEEMDYSTLRDSLTPLMADRKVSVSVDKNGSAVRKVQYRVTSVDGSRLLEATEVPEYDNGSREFDFTFTLKDLLMAGEDYVLDIILTTGNEQQVHYYTRLVQSEDCHVAEKLAFARYIHDATFSPDEATNIRTYLESNSSGDNSSFGNVNIHSSFKQVTWNGFSVKSTTEPIITLRELNRETATIRLDYLLTGDGGDEERLYRVQEYYRVRYTKSRMYLLDYDRTMSQVFEEKQNVYTSQTIAFGIQKETPEWMECSGGKQLAFSVGGRLFALNVSKNTITELYSSYTADSLRGGSDRNLSIREDLYDTKIISVDEMGNVFYLVYGYMDCGDHCGRTGLSLYYYDDGYNLSEELFWVPYDGSFEVLKEELNTLCYISKDNYLYLMLNNSITCIHLDTRKSKVVADNLTDHMYEVSRDGNLVLIQEGEDEYSSLSMKLLHFDTGYDSTIVAPEGCYVMPLGFMGADIIYGIARQEEVQVQSSGRTIFPMYEVVIEDEYGEVLKTYAKDGIYVSGGEIIDNQLVMTRVKKNAKGIFVDTDSDAILNKSDAVAGLNSVTYPVTASFEKVAQLNLNSAIREKEIRIRNSRFAIMEGNHTVRLYDTLMKPDRYYIYGLRGLSGIRTRESLAVTLAQNGNGVVTDRNGNYIWRKGGISSINQIMAIQEEKEDENRSGLAICLDDILTLEGVIRNSQYLLESGQTALQILRENLPDCRILILSGCDVTTLQYYLNQDIPVLTMTESGESYLLIGYNTTQFAMLDPVKGSIYKKSMTDTQEWLEAENAVYVTYVRK